MGREDWAALRNSKFFYVRTYRLAGRLLFVSLALNLLLSLATFYVYFQQPARDFYATSGIVPPVKLTALNQPNNSATPLLAADPAETASAIKLIPD
jgi:intracellular multiplication protein IcmM